MTNADRHDGWHRISPLSILFFVLNFVRQVGFQALPGLVVAWAAISRSDSGSGWVVSAALAILVLLLGYGLLSYLRFRYRLRSDRLVLRRGVLHREELDIEFDRIQNINIREPFYMRPFGLAVLSIDTAGSAGREVQLAGVQRALAIDIRHTILEAADRSNDAPGNAAEEPAAGHDDTLVALTRRDVLIYGLTANFMLWVAIAMGAVFGSGDVTEDTIGWLWQRVRLDQAAETLQRDIGIVLFSLMAAGLVLVILPTISMLGALFRYDGFRLTRKGDTFRKSSGLLTRHDESLRQHKIQAVVWKQNIMARLFRRFTLQLRQASAGTAVDTGQLPQGGKAPFVVPALRRELAERLTGVFLPGSRPGQARFTGIARTRFIVINLCWVLVPLTATFGSLALLVDPRFISAWVIGVLLAWLILSRIAGRFGFAVDGDFGEFRQGFIGHQITVFPLFKVQRVDIRQTPLQHRRDIAHLTVHLASHSLTLPYMNMGDARRFRDLALYHAESTRQKWF